MSQDSLSCVVALIGLPHPHSGKGRGILERCGLFLLDFPSPPEALRALRRELRVDAIVLDGRQHLSPAHADAVTELLAFAQAAPWDGRPLPVVLLTGGDVPAEVLHACELLGVVRVPNKRQQFRLLGLAVLRLCGIESACCHEVAQTAHRSMQVGTKLQTLIATLLLQGTVFG
jgi:CheY-like chemotaxis protein